MNEFEAIDTYYIRASRTIETVLVSNGSKKKVLFIYNYEGYSYRVFDDILKLINFFNDSYETNIEFETDYQLDKYLANYPI